MLCANARLTGSAKRLGLGSDAHVWMTSSRRELQGALPDASRNAVANHAPTALAWQRKPH
ncbi:hypothetical protein VFPFJ_01398 [Purpureocillium lilacinum]|uniref:Uncharacterized protein n=1 Tax=Purpureocillium lilacinum TaxID=33203 RepID=A0A179HAZ1_PURLI|nr:hypothetical protein VFPFJ_01398 [Purpureocillium lilacinum]OAQ87337.1 hypothetical protein VFPBJ_01377 [Purpureocillium lilacinum]OAQ95288.1 hypothetical protein VFPFJ_01398 [Purpureocillium lilacinum]